MNLHSGDFAATEANLSLLKSGKAQGSRFATLKAICEQLDCEPGDILDYEPGVSASSRPRPLTAAPRHL